jgi:hypothetical protein
MMSTDRSWLISFVLSFFVVAMGVAMAPALAVGAESAGAQADALRKNMWLVGIAAVFVVLYWFDRFNVPDTSKTETGDEQEKDEEIHLPATNRSSTTAARYYSAAATYSGVGVAAYIVLVFWPEAWNQLAEALKVSGSEALPAWLHETSSPFVVALALTILVPKIPGFNHADAWLRAKLHYFAAIPDEVRRLSKQLRASDDPAIETHTFSAPQETRRAVRVGLERELAPEVKAGVDLDQWIVFEPVVGSRDLAYRWAKAEVLMRQVKLWESELGFRRFIGHQRDQVNALRARRRALLKRMKELMRVSQAITSNEGAQALAAYQEVVAEDARQFLHDLYDFVSAAVLSRNHTKGRISEALRQLGFQVEWRPLRLTITS